MKLENQTFFKLIMKNKISSIKNQGELYMRFLLCCDVDPEKIGSERPEQNFVRGSSNLDGEAILNLSKFTADEFERKIAVHLQPAIHPSKKTKLVKELLQLIKDDESIADNTKIGFPTSFTKRELLNANQFVLSNFLAQIFKYCVETYAPSKGTSISTEFMNKAEKYISRRDKKILVVDDSESESSDCLDSFGFEDTFEKAFEKIEHLPVSPENTNLKTEILIPYLKRKNQFDVKNIWDLAEDTIMQFVYSWSDLNSIARYTNEKDRRRKLSRASRRAGEYSDLDQKKCFSQMLTLSCLVQTLKAPKILSAYEMHAGHFQSNGVHLSRNNGSISLIFGLSAAVDDLATGLSEMLDQADSIVDNQEDEIRMATSNLNGLKLSKSEEDILINSLIPQPSHSQAPSDSFGFGGVICYNGPEKEVEKNRFRESILNEVQKTQGKLINEITDKELRQYSFSICCIPFNDIDKEARLQDE